MALQAQTWLRSTQPLQTRGGMSKTRCVLVRCSIRCQQIWPNRCWVMTLKSRFFIASRAGPRKHWSAEGRIIPGGKHCFEAHIASNCSSLICAFQCEMSMALRQSLHQDKPAICKHCYAHYRALAFEGGSTREQTRWQRKQYICLLSYHLSYHLVTLQLPRMPS